MNQCPRCHSETLVKAGVNRSGSQRYRCKVCKHYSTLEPKPNGFPSEKHEQALKLYLEGNGLRRTGRLLEVTHQTVANWVNAAHHQLNGLPPQPAECAVIELDELFTYVGQKKTKFTFRPPWIERRVASWAGPWLSNGLLKDVKTSLIKVRVLNNTSAMGFLCGPMSIMPKRATKPYKTNPRPIRLKDRMQNCDIIRLGYIVAPAVFPRASKRCAER